MTTPLLLQNTASSVVVYLELSTGLPATTLTFADVTVGLRKEGGAFLAFPVTALTFTNLSSGFYQIEVTAADTDTLGGLYFSITGATIKASLVAARVVVAASAPPVPPAGYTPPTTTIFGYLYDQAGIAKSNVTVLCRIISKPTILHPTSQGILITDQFLTTLTDAYGFFSIDLITSAQVEVIIADANYRRVITVPNASSNLFDIP